MSVTGSTSDTRRLRFNERSQEHATRKTDAWDPESEQVLLDRLARTSFTHEECLAVAKELGRTFESTRNKVHKLRKEHGITFWKKDRTPAQHRDVRCPVDDDFTDNPEWYA